MNKNYIEKLDLWLGTFPDSLHPYSMERFYAFIKALTESNEYETFNKDVLYKRLSEKQPDWKEDEKNTFIDLWFDKIDIFIEYAKFLVKNK